MADFDIGDDDMSVRIPPHLRPPSHEPYVTPRDPDEEYIPKSHFGKPRTDERLDVEFGVREDTTAADWADGDELDRERDAKRLGRPRAATPGDRGEVGTGAFRNLPSTFRERAASISGTDGQVDFPGGGSGYRPGIFREHLANALVEGKAGPQPIKTFTAVVYAVSGNKDGSVKLTINVDVLCAEEALSMHHDRGQAFRFEVYDL